MNVYTEVSVDGYDRVVYCENDKVNLKAYIAVHSIKLGPSLGGCRLWNYKTKDDALTDVLRLSKGMTYKNALADLKLGGGKSVIWGDSKSSELLEAMGEFVEHVGGDYIIAEDIGINSSDVKIMREKTTHTVNPDIGDPGSTTAAGVFAGIRAAYKFIHGVDSLNDVGIAISGVGSVGMALTKLLLDDGARVTVSDINEKSLMEAANVGAWPSHPAYLHTLEAFPIFSPCALGGIINDEFISTMNGTIIAGAANNQLLEERHGQALMDAGILYAPDFVINSGGVIMVSSGTKNGFSQEVSKKKVNNIGDTLISIFERSKQLNKPTNIIANEMAEEILGIR